MEGFSRDKTGRNNHTQDRQVNLQAYSERWGDISALQAASPYRRSETMEQSEFEERVV
jgi:hypothetical protein